MAIDVYYEGVQLASGTKMMATPVGTFVEMPFPMPIGTKLLLEEGGVACPVRVDRVQEGSAAGVFVVPLPMTTPVTPPHRPRPPEPAAKAEAQAPRKEAVEARPAEASAQAAPVEAVVDAPSGAIDEEMPPVDTEPVAIDAATGEPRAEGEGGGRRKRKRKK